MGKYNDPKYWENVAESEPCECNAQLTITQLAKELNQNLLEMKEVIDSISKCIFSTSTENDGLPSSGTIDSLYSVLLFDREVSGSLVTCLKIIRDKLG